MSRKAVLLIAVLGSWLAAGRLVSAQEVAQHLMGTVRALGEQHFELETTEGIVSVLLDGQTRYEREGKTAWLGDLEAGIRVVVETEVQDGRLRARLVRIGVAAASAREPPMPSGHAGHGTAPPTHGEHPQETAGHRSERTLYQSDMTSMAGMTAHDAMSGMRMPRWRFMIAGIARLHYNHQGGPSGSEALESSNWSMVMAQRDAGPGRLTLMMMNSLEPATMEAQGSPQLFQTGETFDERPLVDRQHPHDLFMNLSATYRLPLGGKAAVWAQAALRGEPALGPAAFMHRASSGENPAAALGHHQQDATHITDDVLTAGIGWRRVSVEASVFHGEEPDETRWDLDAGPLDSVAGRVKLDLARGWSAQVSHGFLHAPEALEEGDTRRTTASLHYGAAGDRPLAATLLWGRNREEHGRFDSVLLEGAYQLTASDQVYARAEEVDRELGLLTMKGLGEDPGAGEPAEETVGVGALTAGYFRDFPLWDALRTGVGVDLTLYRISRRLESIYGESPTSFHVFLRCRWERGQGHGGGHGVQH